MTNPTHDASASAVGYLYQLEWPLIELVVRSRAKPDVEVALELIDDVSWGTDGSPSELIQIKHHTGSTGSLGDMSSDIWRTISAWMDAYPPGDSDGPTLTLVTTDVARDGSAAAALRPPHRDWQSAMAILEEAARTSRAEGTDAARRRFLGLDPTERAAFVSRIQVADGAALMPELAGSLREALHLVLPVGHEETFMDLLHSWWHRCALDMLLKQKSTVSGVELRTYVDDLRDKFTTDNLPTLVDRLAFDQSTVDEYHDYAFVQQLGWIEVPTGVLQLAIQNYYRAVMQSSRWIEENLVGYEEVERFEADLKDEWGRIFAWIEQTLPADAGDVEKRDAGREVLRQAEDLLWIKIRERYSEPFYFRGKLHQLADQGEIGWHPEFRDRLESLLLGTQQ